MGLDGRQSYQSLAKWEKNDSKPPERRWRDAFIDYLWDALRLRNEPAQFETHWKTLTEVWHWEPLTAAERAKLHLVQPTPTGEPDQENVTLLRQFSEFYRRAHDPLPLRKFGARVVADEKELAAWIGRQWSS